MDTIICFKDTLEHIYYLAVYVLRVRRYTLKTAGGIRAAIGVIIAATVWPTHDLIKPDLQGGLQVSINLETAVFLLCFDHP